MKRMSADVAQGLLGVQADGRLSPCPDMPNCVCSQYPSDKEHAASPLIFKGTQSQAIVLIKKVMANLKRVDLAAERDNYLRFESTSLLLRFVDDIEFLIDSQAGLIHVRSASRVGYSDLGVNRSRVESIHGFWKEMVK
jgi:uncharacterized protein (DUF1499 family)